MRRVQIILNAILSKNIFEYIMIDNDLKVMDSSVSSSIYMGSEPSIGDDILNYIPEFIGSEDEIKKIFNDSSFTYVLQSVKKGDYYLNISIEHFEQGSAMILIHNITEITLSKQKLLQYSNESVLLSNTLQKILDTQNALVFVSNNEEIAYANQQFMEYFGVLKVEDLRSKDLKLYLNYDEKLNSYDELFDAVKEKEKYLNIEDDIFILQSSLVEVTHKLFTLTKVTNLSNEMHIDTLTGIYKKSFFSKELTKALKKVNTCAVAVLDLDDFKNVNDTYGHQVGDDILKEFTSLISKSIRQDDIFARWGGEEFLLLLQDTNIKNALMKINTICKMVDNHEFKIVKHLTASFGLSFCSENDTLDTILYRADTALYEAKAQGKNRVVFKDVDK